MGAIMNRIGLIYGAVVLAALPGFAVTAKAASDQDEIIRRLDRLEQAHARLEQENAALRTKLNRVDGGSGARSAPQAAGPQYADPGQPNIAVKAPVEYVRACSMYGAGFYTVPGTDACIKIGGYIRLQGGTGGSGEGTVNGADIMAPQGRNNRFDTSQVNYDARAVVSADARVPTSIGLLRGYMRLGAEMDTPIGSNWMTTLTSPPQPAQSNAPFLLWDRGYIQFAGFTVGKQRSFFDLFAASDGYLTYGNLRTTGDTDLTGVILAAFTYNAGNGFSASVSVEDPNGHYKIGVGDLNGVAMTPTGVITPSNGYVSGALNQGMGVPDIIANLRVDQSWGYAGISGALHQVAGDYYSGASAAGSGTGCIGLPCTAFGHPSDKFGGAVAFGGNVYVPTGPGDTLGVNLVYSQGAVDFATKGNTWQLYKGKTAGFGWGFDGVYDNVTPNCPVAGGCPSSIQLTKAWSINAGFEHHWSDQWKTSAYGGFAAVNYNQLAANLINQHLPSPPAGGTACGMPVEGIIQPPLGVGSGIGNSCNPSYSFFQVGSRTQYSPTPWLDLGVDTTYTKLYSAYKGLGNPTALGVVNGVALAASGAQPSGLYSITNQSEWMVLARAQIHFLPGK
jgi:Porin subfamily